jgi:hypothetical protein
MIPPKGADFITIKRDSCSESLPIPEGSKAYPGYGPGEGIEVSTQYVASTTADAQAWHKENGQWVD